MHNERDAGEVALLPCPFCGSADLDQSTDATGFWMVGCKTCCTDGPTGMTRTRSISLWNTRPPAPEDARTVERVKLKAALSYARRAWICTHGVKGLELDDALTDAALAALSRLDGAMGADMVLVPRVPTEAMVMAAYNYVDDVTGMGGGIGLEGAVELWDAMLAASKGEK